jgi:hypothetical protein
MRNPHIGLHESRGKTRASKNPGAVQRSLLTAFAGTCRSIAQAAPQSERVGFGYLDEPGGSRRGFEVGNERPGRRRLPERPALQEDVGIWRSDLQA